MDYSRIGPAIFEDGSPGFTYAVVGAVRAGEVARHLTQEGSATFNCRPLPDDVYLFTIRDDDGARQTLSAALESADNLED